MSILTQTKQAKERKVKCFICGISSEKNEMEYIETKKRWVHKINCKEEFEWQLEMIEKDKKEWEELYEYIKQLHDLIDLPKAIIVRLKLLRKGKDMVKGQEIRKWKNGASFGLMKEAYILANDSIKYWMKNKFSDDPRSTNCINYCMTIAIDNFNKAYTIRKKKEQQVHVHNRVEQEMSYKTIEDINVNLQNNTKKKKDEKDISSFL